jgi:hypothetical protein
MSKRKQRPQRSALTEVSEMSETERIIQQGRERQEALQSDGRGRPGHAGEVGVDKRGQAKATYYFPKARQDLIRKIASDEDLTQGSIVEAAIVAFYNAWKAGKVNLENMKTPARSLKATWELRVPDEFGFFSDKTQ